MKINFLILVMILSACQNMENRNENSFFKNEKENIINMNSTISEREIKN